MHLWLTLLFSLASVRGRSIARVSRKDSSTITFKCINYSDILMHGGNYFIKIISDNGFKYTKTSLASNNYISVDVYVSKLRLPDKFTFLCINDGGISTLIVDISKDLYIKRVEDIKKSSASKTVCIDIIYVMCVLFAILFNFIF